MSDRGIRLRADLRHTAAAAAAAEPADDGGIHSCHRPISQDAGMCMAQMVHIQIYLNCIN